MRVTLCIPRLSIAGTTSPREPMRFKLVLTTKRAESSHGLGVLLSGDAIFEGGDFRHLRDTLGAWLEAEDLDRVRGAMGLPAGEKIGK